MNTLSSSRRRQLRLSLCCCLLLLQLPQTDAQNEVPRRCPILLPQNSTRQSTRSPLEDDNGLSTSLKKDRRIIGGSPLNSTLLPYLASIFISKDYESFFTTSNIFVCSAVVVGPRTIFTAAHCVKFDKLDQLLNPSANAKDPSRPEWFTVFFGSKTTVSSSAIPRTVKSVDFHPKWVESNYATWVYDVAYLTLDEDIPETNKFMKVNTNRNIPVPGSVVRNMGYGYQRYFDSSVGNYDSDNDPVQQLDIPVTSLAYCRNAYEKAQESEDKKIRISPTNHICAGYLNGGCSSCNGDSGGPIFQYDKSEIPVLVGITSFGVRCGLEVFPTVYARVSAFVRNFYPTKGLTLTNTTDAFILPEEKRAYPEYIEDNTNTGKSEGGLSEMAIIVIGVAAAVLVVLVIGIAIWCV